jgi:hypothetical protein
MPVGEFQTYLLASNKNPESSISGIKTLLSSITKSRRIKTMKMATITQIKQIKNRLEVLPKLGIELDLDSILLEEFQLGLPSDNNIGL